MSASSHCRPLRERVNDHSGVLRAVGRNGLHQQAWRACQVDGGGPDPLTVAHVAEVGFRRNSTHAKPS
jgi:hypothetical protein